MNLLAFSQAIANLNIQFKGDSHVQKVKYYNGLNQSPNITMIFYKMSLKMGKRENLALIS